MNLIQYWFAVAQRFWSWYSDEVLSSVIWCVPWFIAGAIIQRLLSGRWPFLKLTWGDFMADGAKVLIYGVLSVGAVGVICMLLAAIILPPRIHAEQAAKLKTGLRAEILTMGSGESSEPLMFNGKFQSNVAAVVMAVRVTNVDEPTIASDWKLKVHHKDKEFTGSLLIQDRSKTMALDLGETGEVLLGANQHLHAKTLRDPIGKNAAETGILVFAFSELSAEELRSIKDSSYSLTFNDAAGRVVKAVKFKSGDDFPHPIPGIESVFRPKNSPGNTTSPAPNTPE